MPFERPDEETRKEIWQSCFSDPATEVVEEGFDAINYDSLARELEITGGEIKNIALNAAFLAAEEGRPIGMPQILRAVNRDAVKRGSYLQYDMNVMMTTQ